MKRILISVAAAAAIFVLAPSAATAGDAAAGKPVFEANCMSCHGATGKGDGPVGAVLQPPPRDFSVGDFKYDADKNGTPGEDADIKMVIQQGAGAFGGSPLMAPWGGMIEDGDVDNLVAYIRSLKR